MKKLIATVLFLCLAFSACGGALPDESSAGLPQIDELLTGDKAVLDSCVGMSKSELLDAWGPPYESESEELDVWRVNDKYLRVKYKNGNVTLISVSVTVLAKVHSMGEDRVSLHLTSPESYAGRSTYLPVTQIDPSSGPLTVGSVLKLEVSKEQSSNPGEAFQRVYSASIESRNHPPTLEEFFALGLQDDISNAYRGVPLEEFLEKWGEPESSLVWTDGETEEYLWNVNGKFAAVYAVGGSVVLTCPSVTLTVKVAEIRSDLIIAENLEKDSPNQRIQLQPEWLPQDISVGTVLQLEHDGMFMQLDPAIINIPYSVTVLTE